MAVNLLISSIFPLKRQCREMAVKDWNPVAISGRDVG
jgi:hypothetical protein